MGDLKDYRIVLKILIDSKIIRVVTVSFKINTDISMLHDNKDNNRLTNFKTNKKRIKLHNDNNKLQD